MLEQKSRLHLLKDAQFELVDVVVVLLHLVEHDRHDFFGVAHQAGVVVLAQVQTDAVLVKHDSCFEHFLHEALPRVQLIVPLTE